MLSIYTSYRCRICKNEFVVLTEEVEQQAKRNRYLVCPYCSSRRVTKEKIADSLKERMQERSYRRIKGALRQK